MPFALAISTSVAVPEGGRVHEALVRELGGWILGGRYGPGALLPREEDLASQLGVCRTTLREAVKVLSAKGMIEARPRVGLKIRPREEWRLLDPAVLSWHPDIRQDPVLVDSLIEARRIIEPAAAALAARRATARDLAVVETAWNTMVRSVSDDLEACCDADLAFHRGVIVASHNLVLIGLIGTIEAALRATFLASSELIKSQSASLAIHGEVLDRIRMRDEAGARAAMERLLTLAAIDLGRSI